MDFIFCVYILYSTLKIYNYNSINVIKVVVYLRSLKNKTIFANFPRLICMADSVNIKFKKITRLQILKISIVKEID